MTIETCKYLAEKARERGDEATALEYEARIERKLTKRPRYSSFKKEDWIKAKTSTTKSSTSK